MKNFFLLYILIFSLYLDAEIFIGKINFRGNESFSKKKLLNNFTTKERTGFFKKKRDILNRDILDYDIEQTIKFYQTEGFLDVKIDYKLEKNKKDNNIIITINEGIPVIISEIEYNSELNNKIINEIIIKAEKYLKLKTGERFTDNNLRKTKLQIFNILVNNGYPKSKVEFKLYVNKNKNNVKVIFDIKDDLYCLFDSYDFTGNGKISPKYIVERLSFSEGEEFKQKKLEQTQSNLMNLGVFQTVSVNYFFNSGNKVPIKIDMKEMDKFNVKFGIGYGLEEKIRFSMNLLKIGVFRPIDRVKFYMKFSKIEPYHFNMKLSQPFIFFTNNDLETSLFLSKDNRESFKLKRFGGSIEFSKRIFKYTSIFGGYLYERNKLHLSSEITEEDNVSLLDKYNKSNFYGGISFNNSSPSFYPYKGFITNFSITYAGVGFNSDFHYYQLLLELRKYFKIYENITFATKFKVGIMQTRLNDKTTPIEERYFAGGANSNRGWAFGKLGPKNKKDNYIGGNSLIENGVELRFPIYKIIYGVLFSDFGNVWSKSYTYKLYDLKYGNGFGLRVKTPIGPIRFDFGLSQYMDFQFFVSIGEAF